LKPRIAIIAALPRELAVLTKGWRADKALAAKKIYLFESDRAVVCCAGMGVARGTLAVEAALSRGPVSRLISAGWAGACKSGLFAGDVVWAGTVVNAATGERYFNPEYKQVVVSVERVAGTAEKQRLAATYGADAVDMEGATVARLALAHSLPYGAIKVISDEAEMDLSLLADFATMDGQFREAAFALHAAMRPRMWPMVMKLARNGQLAAKKLAAVLEEEIKQRENE